MTETITIRGKGLYVEIHGPEDAPPLLFLHGGPGGAGSYEFMKGQGDRLSKQVRLIAFDQRGVLRSEALGEHDPLTLQDLIDDCEALRLHFGYERWSVLGHSFGGFLATLYAHRHPESVEKLVLDCPALDFDLSAKFMLKKSADEFLKLGDEEHAKQAHDVTEADLSPKDRFNQMVTLTSALKEHRDKLYWYRPIPNYFGNLLQTSGLTSEEWERTGMHVKKIMQDPLLFTSLLPLLPDLQCPTLLLRGESDSTTCDIQTAAVLRDVKRSEHLLIEEAGHVPAIEQADRFAEVVTEFLLRP
jgi:proline iminopeptidase